MMCDHCENRIKESLEALAGVAEVTASSDAGTAVVRFTAPVEYEALEKAVADAGYTLLRAEDAGAAPACVRTTVVIEGMVCENCEAHVCEAVEKNFDVQSVSADHEKGLAEIVSTAALDEEKLRQVISDTGYELVSVTAESC
jgi:Cu2+-exporting ATPase